MKLDYKDGSEVFYSKKEEEAFAAEIKRIASERLWIKLPVTSFTPASAEFLNAEDPIAEDTQRQSNAIVFTENMGELYLSGWALKQFQERTESACGAMTRLQEQRFDAFILRLCEDVETYRKTNKNKETNVCFFEGKIRGFLGPNYRVMNPDEVFQTAKNSFQTLAEEVSFLAAYVSHNFYQVSYLLDSLDIRSAYAELLTSAGKETKQEQILLCAKVSTSDTGCASARIRLDIKVLEDNNKSRTLVLNSDKGVPHRGVDPLKKFSEYAEDVLAVYQKRIADLERLQDIPVNYWESCMEHIMLAADISKKLAMMTVEMRRNSFGPIDNALDLYFAICEAPAIAQRSGLAPKHSEIARKGANPQQLMDLEEKVCACLKKMIRGISRYDRPYDPSDRQKMEY